MSEQYHEVSGGVTERSRKLAHITEELESVKQEMDERGSSMTDGSMSHNCCFCFCTIIIIIIIIIIILLLLLLLLVVVVVIMSLLESGILKSVTWNIQGGTQKFLELLKENCI